MTGEGAHGDGEEIRVTEERAQGDGGNRRLPRKNRHFF